MALTKISRGLLDTGVSDSSDATAITIDSSERVGIGTTSPDRKLHLNEAASSTSNFIHLTTADTGTTGSNGFLVGIGSTGVAELWNYEAQPISFATSSTERMRIDSSGNVGIGTTSPSRQVHLNNASDHGIMAITGSTSSLAGVVFGDTADDDVSSIIHNNSGNYLYLSTSSTERMRIDSNGKVTVDPGGTFADDSAGVLQLRTSTATGGWAISARSTVTTSSGTWFIGKQSNGTNVFSLVSDSDSIDLTFLSDERMKMNITDSADVLDKVKQITVKDFDWRTELNGDTKDNTRETKKYGFIAQNFQSIGLGQYVKEVMPTDENDDTLGMDYGNITPILVKAIQEQQEQIEALQAEINTLKGE